ncbi:DUF1648 domain-containing protein [Anaerocolumna sedimenticola]|uniref:DUF1648 domain-containing protein n=1 Tax=Anaerocolumna sedimenticola TaxID=2696063 RepID=A0A6P1TSA9_9FIRM|nr:SdpI family protein [Anaerocolumna sedimenticola]QHQ62626.1 DUF1648 domain-containing protein [Anaerocolumna sedimenticola]
MNKIRKDIIWILSILSYIGCIIIYPSLPKEIPIHWNVAWEIDNWADKKYIFLIGLFPFIILLIFDDYIRFKHNIGNNKKQIKVKNILKSITALLMILLNWITVAAAFELDVNIKLLIPFVIGSIFIFIGNYMPALKSNYFMGIRNPWTLSNDMVWRKTHKAGGYMFIVIGFLMVLMGFLQRNMINIAVFAVLMISIIGINLYSYLIYRKTK